MRKEKQYNGNVKRTKKKKTMKENKMDLKI